MIEPTPALLKSWEDMNETTPGWGDEFQASYYKNSENYQRLMNMIANATLEELERTTSLLDNLDKARKGGHQE